MSSFKSVSIVSISFFIQTLSGIVFYLIIARTLPVVEVGAITLFLSFGGIFIVLFSLNLDTAFAHFVSYFFGETKQYSLPRFFLMIAAIMVGVSFGVTASLSHLISAVFFHSAIYTDLLILMAGYISASIGLGYMVSILQGLQSFKLAAVSNIMYSVLSMGIPVGMSAFKAPLEIIAAGFVIGAVISFIAALSFVLGRKVPVIATESGFDRKVFSYVIPVYLGSLASSLMGTIDRVILPAMTNLILSAVYTYSLTIATIVTAITSPFSFLLLPKISQALSASNKKDSIIYTHGSMEFFYYIALPASLGATVLSKPLLDVLVGGIYASHYMVLQIMVFSYSFFSFRPILSSILLGNRKTKTYLYSGVAALIINLLLSITLIPLFGIYGAVAASVSAWAASTIPRMVAVNALVDHSLSFVPYIRMWVNAFIMAGIVFIVAERFSTGLLALFIPVMVGITAYIALSIVNRPFSSGARELIRSIITSEHPLIHKISLVLIG